MSSGVSMMGKSLKDTVLLSGHGGLCSCVVCVCCCGRQHNDERFV